MDVSTATDHPESGSTKGGGGGSKYASSTTRSPAPPSMTVRARRRREEAVRRLVADVQSIGGGMDRKPGGGNSGSATTSVKSLSSGSNSNDGIGSNSGHAEAAYNQETQDWLVASTVATALEKGLDRDLHSELVQDAKDNAGRIGQICHDHADIFLASVGRVAALEKPSAVLATGLKEAQSELQRHTAGPMLEAALQWEEARQAYARARTLHVMVRACQRVAVQLERARKQASLGRPRSALDAVDQARAALTTPMDALFQETDLDQDLWNEVTQRRGRGGRGGDGSEEKDDANMNDNGKNAIDSLEQTPFGARAAVMLPKVENEVLMNARRGLNRWFLSLRSGGEGAKAGRAVLRRCAHSSLAVGPGQLGLGGHLPPSYVWRAKTADNLIARMSQNGKVARSVRMGYWFDRDASKEAERLENNTRPGLERRAEALASAFGWYRCWEESSSLLLDPSDYTVVFADGTTGLGSAGLSGSRHGLSGSRHGLRGSRHGKRSTLGFRASTSSRSQAFQEISSGIGGNVGGAGRAGQSQGNKDRSKWGDFLTPIILMENSAGRVEEDRILMALPESVHPVRRAESAFSLLGKADEFVQYYEANRFGEMKIGGGGGDAGGVKMDDTGKGGENRSALSSLTGDDVSVGTDRIFFAKTLSHLCASVVGFSAVEAALELGNFANDDDIDGDEDYNNNDEYNKGSGGSGQQHPSSGGGAGSNKAVAAAASSEATAGFRESSERYERTLVAELGQVLRSRARRAHFGEFVRASNLMSSFRAALKIVHPGSSTRRHDKDLLALDADILMTALKIAQDEQLKATSAIVADDPKTPVLVADAYAPLRSEKTVTGVPDPEMTGLPFGLSQMKQKERKADVEFQEQSRTSYNRAPSDETYTFSQSVPVVLRSIHARAIACAAFALSQEELGQKFPDKKGSAPAGFVLDCVEESVNVAAVGMKDSDNVVEEGSVDKAVQVMANIAALQHCLPRLYGTLVRGMCHIGLIRADEIEDTLSYAEKTLRNADKACDAQVGNTYSLVYEICRNKIDSHINYALENFQWVAKSSRDMPNAYCEGLIGYLTTVFASLGPMDEGSRAGLHFSCCGHVCERMVKILSGKPGDTTGRDDSGVPPIARIDAFGIQNLALDCSEFEKFADSTGIPRLRDCFDEFKVLTTVMLDKELPALLLPENAAVRRRKYPILSLDKIGNILEKYVGTGLGDKLMGGSGRKSDVLFMDKKEVMQLVKIVRAQVH